MDEKKAAPMSIGVIGAVVIGGLIGHWIANKGDIPQAMSSVPTVSGAGAGIMTGAACSAGFIATTTSWFTGLFASITGGIASLFGGGKKIPPDEIQKLKDMLSACIPRKLITDILTMMASGTLDLTKLLADFKDVNPAAILALVHELATALGISLQVHPDAPKPSPEPGPTPDNPPAAKAVAPGTVVTVV